MRRIASLGLAIICLCVAGCSSVGWNVSIYAGTHGNSEFESGFGAQAGIVVTFSNRTPIPVSPNINQTTVRVNNNQNQSQVQNQSGGNGANGQNNDCNGGKGHKHHTHNGHGNGHDCDSDD